MCIRDSLRSSLPFSLLFCLLFCLPSSFPFPSHLSFLLPSLYLYLPFLYLLPRPAFPLPHPFSFPFPSLPLLCSFCVFYLKWLGVWSTNVVPKVVPGIVCSTWPSSIWNPPGGKFPSPSNRRLAQAISSIIKPCTINAIGLVDEGPADSKTYPVT